MFRLKTEANLGFNIVVQRFAPASYVKSGVEVGIWRFEEPLPTIHWPWLLFGHETEASLQTLTQRSFLHEQRFDGLQSPFDLSLCSFSMLQKLAKSWQSMGRSRGWLTSKIHAVVDTNGMPVRRALTAGEAHDTRRADRPAVNRLVAGSNPARGANF